MIKISNDCEIDLENLIATRMLINANSGGGKSWAIRRLLEQSHGQVQQIVIDLEGEFSTLREKFDYLLVGRDGEIPVSIRTAEILARRLLELNVSSIIDLSELKKAERITFVKRFLDSLIDAPKNLWHPALILVDEAHHFAPEKEKSESTNSVIDLMTRGRKRGFAGVLATQRISKLNKDAIAEANNCMIGRAILDIDQKRAGDILGFTSKEDVRSLRDLKQGEFYMFGSAFSHNGVKKTKVGSVKTTHPDRTKGVDIVEPVETPTNIKRLLKDIVDLPKEAEEELKDLNDYKNKVRELRTKLTIAEKSKPELKIDQKALERAKDQGYKEGLSQSIDEKNRILKDYKQTEKKLIDIGKIVGIKPPQNPLVDMVKNPGLKKIMERVVNYPEPEEKPKLQNQPIINVISDTPLRAGAMKMLNWLGGSYPKELSKQRLATLSGFSVTGGTFNTYISELKRNGWIVGANELSITQEGLENSDPQPIPSGEELLELWKSKFRQGAARILQYIYENYPNEVSKEEIGYSVGFESSGGTFNTYISELRRNRLIEINGTGIKVSQEFFE